MTNLQAQEKEEGRRKREEGRNKNGRGDDSPAPFFPLPFSFFPCTWPFQPHRAGLKDEWLRQNVTHSKGKRKREEGRPCLLPLPSSLFLLPSSLFHLPSSFFPRSAKEETRE